MALQLRLAAQVGISSTISVPPAASGDINSNMLMLKLKRAIAGITSPRVNP